MRSLRNTVSPNKGDWSWMTHLGSRTLDDAPWITHLCRRWIDVKPSTKSKWITGNNHQIPSNYTLPSFKKQQSCIQWYEIKQQQNLMYIQVSLISRICFYTFFVYAFTLVKIRIPHTMRLRRQGSRLNHLHWCYRLWLCNKQSRKRWLSFAQYKLTNHRYKYASISIFVCICFWEIVCSHAHKPNKNTKNNFIASLMTSYYYFCTNSAFNVSSHKTS